MVLVPAFISSLSRLQKIFWRPRARGFIRIMQLRPTRRSSFVIRRKASLTGAPNASMDAINWCWWFYANAWKRKMVLRTRMKSSIGNLPGGRQVYLQECGESRPMQGLFPSILSITRSLKVRIFGMRSPLPSLVHKITIPASTSRH